MQLLNIESEKKKKPQSVSCWSSHREIIPNDFKA